MEEINIGEYVRTTEGYIRKVIDMCECELQHLILDKEIHGDTYIDKGDIVKHSKDIIDLVEPGDIVNGRKIKEVRNIDGKIYLMTNYIVQDYIKTDIKSILTKEQYEKNCYEVEVKDE